MAKAEAEPTPLTVGQVARILGLSTKRVQDMVDEGKLVAERAPYPPFARLITQASVDALVEARSRA